MKLILIILFFAACSPCKVAVKEVKKVGGCNRYGKCGVVYTDDTFDEVYHPVEGRHYRTCGE